MVEHKMGQLETMQYVAALKKEPVKKIEPVKPDQQKDHPETPSRLEVPTYLMNFPLTLETASANNVWMKGKTAEEKKINYGKANNQWINLYQFLASQGMVYLLPNMGEFQDQVYVANLGIFLPHVKHQGRDIMLISNFKSMPRRGEERVGDAFFSMMKYAVFELPTFWEGEAELKYVRDNIFIGGYGIRSDIKSYEWMEQNFNMKIIKVKEIDEHLYHLDCSIFPLTADKVFVCTRIFNSAEVKQIEKVADIIDVPVDYCHQSFTNCTRIGNIICIASGVDEMHRNDKDYLTNKNMLDFMDKTCSDNGMEMARFNLSEYEKSGAALSCCVMHLNYADYYKPLI